MNTNSEICYSTKGLEEIGLDCFPPYLMNRIMSRYNSRLRDELTANGLTTPQMRSLAVLSVVDGMQMRELAVHAAVEQSTLSRALDNLVRHGLIRRETDKADNRGIRIYITSAGQEVYARLWPFMAKSYEAMFAGISAKEEAILVTALQKILRNISRRDF